MQAAPSYTYKNMQAHARYAASSINSTYGADASVPVVVQYIALHMYISSYMQVLDKQSEE